MIIGLGFKLNSHIGLSPFTIKANRSELGSGFDTGPRAQIEPHL